MGDVLRTYARWPALGSFAFLTTDDPRNLERAERIAVGLVAAVDRTCSRFRADSDLSRANRDAGTWVRVHPLLAAAAGAALEAARATDGLVDPCLGRPVAALGYDADFDLVRRRSPAEPRRLAPHDPEAWRELQVDPEGGVLVPEGARLDLGAIAKAWASDLVAGAVVDEVGGHVAVSLGGDVRLDSAPDAKPRRWPVLVTERPGDDGVSETVHLAGGGLATSSTLARRWRVGDEVRHDLLDPRTGLPVDGVWRTVTALGDTCVEANTASTAALVLGEDALPWLRPHMVAARLVDHDDRIRHTGPWPRTNVTRLPRPRRPEDA